MEGSQHIKTLNTDARGKNRIRYASSKQRAKSASADVYRSKKRRTGVTGAAAREERVHFVKTERSKKKRSRKDKSGAVAILDNDDIEGGENVHDMDTEGTTVATELDLAHDRNASEIFTRLHRDLWPLVRSLPEVLHHSQKIMQLLMGYLLSPEGDRSVPSRGNFSTDYIKKKEKDVRFVTNLATTDVLHLLAVSARDLRHEIHPYLFTLILPRITIDMLNPPPSDRQPAALEVTVVEAAFRTLSYIFRYDMAPILSSIGEMRKYYGLTLGHPRELVRRLSAETFAPLIRKIDDDSEFRRHLRQVVVAVSMASQQTRALDHAIEGVSELLFQTSKGVPGRMHSKGSSVIKSVLDSVARSLDNSEKSGETIFRIASCFFEKLQMHLLGIGSIWKEFLKVINRIFEGNDTANEGQTVNADALHYLMQLLSQTVSFRNGFSLQQRSDFATKFMTLLEDALHPDRLATRSRIIRTSCLRLLCSIWIGLPSHDDVDDRCSVLVSTILKYELSSQDCFSGNGAAQIVARELLPHLPLKVAMRDVGRAMLLSALESKEEEQSLFLIHAVATTPHQSSMENLERRDGDYDKVCFVENARHCDLSSMEQLQLLSKVTVDADTEAHLHCSRITYSCPCASFLALARLKNATENEAKIVCNIFMNWIRTTLQDVERHLTKPSEKNEVLRNKGSTPMGWVVAKSMILESLATVVMGLHESMQDTSMLEKAIIETRAIAVDHMLMYQSSIWAVKSVSAFAQAAELYQLPLLPSGSSTTIADDVFDALSPNLRHQSHFLRLHTIEILNIFPIKSFVTDHSDLDFTDDLDEDGANRGRSDSSAKLQVNGPCTILTTLLDLESTPISLQNERHLTSLISKVEVIARTGKLPVVYAEAASNHMFGLFYIKFSPLWPAAVKALVALASTQEDCFWPAMAEILTKIVVPDDSIKYSCKNAGDPFVSVISGRHDSFVEWDTSGGRDYRLFGDQDASQQGRVSRYLSTDAITVFDNIFNVLEGIPLLVTRKSKTFVPVFLKFLHLQYFLFNGNDPDARELELDKHVTEKTSWTRDDLSRKALEKKLSCFLRVLAAIRAPKQLYKHGLLQSIFNAFLSHQDASTAQLALRCIFRFRNPAVMPYAEHLKNLLNRGEFRAALLNFDLSSSGGLVSSNHRTVIIPLVSRILFGRLSAKGSSGKSSKDSPAVRRAAGLSFLAVLGQSENELSPFLYLMTRIFVPANFSLKPVEQMKDDDWENIIGLAKRICSEDVFRVHLQRQQGFLNLMSDLIAQVGYGMKHFVSSFVSIVLAICEHVQAGQTDIECDKSGRNRIEHKTAIATRVGNLRTLCFRRIDDLFNHFEADHDFTDQSERLWKATSCSIEMLPGAVINADKAPAMLSLLVTISSSERLIPMLSNCPKAIESVVKCISKKSTPNVLESSLSFVDNLLSNGHSTPESASVAYGSVGVSLISGHIPLLMNQFSARLAFRQADEDESTEKPRSKKIDLATRRELAILCRLTELVIAEGASGFDKGGTPGRVLTDLCALLIPFLSHDARASEEDQMNVLAILVRVLPKVRGEVALRFVPSLATLLGPRRGCRGISALPVRREISAMIRTIANCGVAGQTLERVSEMLSKLCATHPGRVDEIDYDQLVPALNSLGNAQSRDQGWLGLLEEGISLFESGFLQRTGSLLPLVYQCFHFLYDEDGVVSRGSFKALKGLVNSASNEAQTQLNGVMLQTKAKENEWIAFFEKYFVPSVRAGLNSRNQPVRRYFVLLMAEVSRCFEFSASPNLYGDLSCLIREDDPEVDFFLNLTHVQIHRRGRAMQRLRRMLNSNQEGVFSLQSLSNVLLPLTMNAVYECKSNSEETFVTESIATIGTIAKFLSWNKYHKTLWSALIHFSRHPEQERYIVGMICSVIDGFHFELKDDHSAERCRAAGLEGERKNEKSPVFKAMENRIIPKLESLLVKEKLGPTGTKDRVLRAPIVLAMLKLFQKFPSEFFESKIPRLLAIICSELKERDSDARDIARSTLAKMTSEMNEKYLPMVIRELAVSLTEGYQLHIRAACLHSILTEITGDSNESGSHSKRRTAIDVCVPLLMDLIQQDLFGEATERKEVEGTRKRIVKEAHGSKSMDSIEIISRNLTFIPSATLTKNQTEVSTIHAVVSPFLERLRVPDTDASTISKIRVCLNRVVVGLSHNSSVNLEEEIFPFVYASIYPFVGSLADGKATTVENDVGENEDDMNYIHVSSKNNKAVPNSHNRQETGSESSPSADVFEWRPSTLAVVESALKAQDMKIRDKRGLSKVEDGTSAPKLTGSHRQPSTIMFSNGCLNNPSHVCAVVFALSLLKSFLKRTVVSDAEETIKGKLDPFISILSTCIFVSNEKDVVLLSLQCIGYLLRLNLPSAAEFSPKIGSKVLDLLSSSGSLSNLKQELAQGCFKTLTLLIHRRGHRWNANSLEADAITESHVLDAEQLNVLTSIVRTALAGNEQHNATFSLIRALLTVRVSSPEFYDLMETVLQLTASSGIPSVRQQCSLIFMQYLLYYPMGSQRLDAHLRQMVLNVNYEHEDGRISSIGLVNAVIEKLPVPLLEDKAQLLFLPLVLQYVNDESKNGREATANCLSRLLTRTSVDVVQSFYNYAMRWSNGNTQLRRTSIQLLGLFVDARVDFITGAGLTKDLSDLIHENLKESIGGEEWQIPYFSLVCFEKLFSLVPSIAADNPDLWMKIVKCMGSSHPWVRQISARLIGSHMSSFDPTSFADREAETFLLHHTGSIFEVARNFCAQINLLEGNVDGELVALLVRSLTWIAQAMHRYPSLCFATKADDNERTSPLKWLMTRLSQISKHKGELRREAVFKCFAAFATCVDVSVMSPHLELMLEPLYRVVAEVESITEQSHKYSKSSASGGEGELAQDVLQLLEEKCGTDLFLAAYASVKTRAREKRDQRKQQLAAEAVRNPEASSRRKIKKHEKERQRKKRKVAERRIQ